MKRMSYKTQKIVKWVVIGSGLTLLTLFTLLWLLVTLFLFGGPAKKSSSIKDYQDIFEMNVKSGLLVFPEEVAEDATDVMFSYYFRDTWDDPTVSIFLQCTYTPEDYEAEVYRLEHTKKVYGGTERGLMRDEDNKYPYPAYIAIDNHHHQYEYALLTGDGQITYIHTAWFDRDKVKFSQEYLPVDYMVADVTSPDYFYSGYSMYIKSVDKGSLGGINYDYTRDENVVVRDGHSERIDDSYFTVRVQLDEQNREIITECEFAYYEPAADLNNVFTYDEESDDTIFTDLAGYEYRGMRLSEDRTTVIVTYLEEGVEKEWQMELTQFMKKKE